MSSLSKVMSPGRPRAHRPFRFGVQASAPPDVRRWRDMARRVESLGYSTLLVADHVGGDDLAPIPALAAAAQATTTLRLGTLVINNDLRHPSLLARDIASLDILSGGRIELGIGAGWARSEYESLGLPFDEPAVRVARLAEAIGVIRASWTGHPVQEARAHYRVRGLGGLPRPVQRPGPPILLAGGGPVVGALAAREADIVGVHLQMHRDGSGEDWSTGTLAATQRRVERIRAAAGARIEALELQMMVMTLEVTADRQAAADRIAHGTRSDPGEVLDSPYRLIGSVDEIVSQLEERRGDLGVSYFVVPLREAEAFAPVVTRLSGR